jgi:4-hydroxy-4-methyl-2-oxoglutarate aldolase
MTDRPPAELATALADLGAATLGESGARLMPPRIRPVWTGAVLAAPALAVRCAPGDNLAIHVAVASAPPGHALVVDVGDVPDRGYWGEVLTTGAESRQVSGLVIDGCVRDVTALADHGFPVFSAGVALRGATKVLRGSVGRAVEVAGVRVAPGDWVVGDADGVVVVPGDALEDVLAAGRARADKESTFFSSLRGGRTTIELLGLDTGPVEVEGDLRAE